jgi:hypothetical protein
MHSSPECPPGYTKKLAKDRAINSFFAYKDVGKEREQERQLRYASRTLRTTLHGVQLMILG